MPSMIQENHHWITQLNSVIEKYKKIIDTKHEIHRMCFLSRLGREKAAELLINSGADVNQANNKVCVEFVDTLKLSFNQAINLLFQLKFRDGHHCIGLQKRVCFIVAFILK